MKLAAFLLIIVSLVLIYSEFFYTPPIVEIYHPVDSYITGFVADPDALNPLISSGIPAKKVERLIFGSLIREIEPELFQNWSTKIAQKKYECDLAEHYQSIENKDVWYIHLLKGTTAEVIIEKCREKNLPEIKKISRSIAKTPVIKLTLSEPVEEIEPILDKLQIQNLVRFSFEEREIIFYLRKNVKWHDQMPFTAEDVKFTWLASINPEYKKVKWRDPFLKIESIDCLNDYTARVRYNNPYGSLAAWMQKIIPAHIFKVDSVDNSKYNSEPVGTGPYMFERWEPKSAIYLKANPDYYDTKPQIANIIIRTIPDQSEMFQKLMEDEIDSMELNADQYLKQSPSAEFSQRFNVHEFSSGSYTLLGFNLAKEPFSHLNFRKACTYACDTDWLIQKAMKDFAVHVTGPVDPEDNGFNQDVKRYEYNPQKAKQLMKEEGWTDSDNDGILDKNGEKLSFTILVNTGSMVKEIAAEYSCKTLRELGMDVTLEYVEWTELLRRLKRKEYDTFIFTRYFGLLSEYWHSKHIPSENNSFSGLNYAGYSNPKVDAIIDFIGSSGTLEEKIEKSKEAHAAIYADSPFVFFFSAKVAIAIHRRFKNTDQPFVKWYVPSDEIKYK